jgi:hypothetical protein
MSPGERHTIPLVTAHVFDFSGLAAGTSLVLPVARRIWVGFHQEATLMVRMHSSDIELAATITIAAAADGSTLEEPGAFFAQVVATTHFDKSSPPQSIQHLVLPSLGARLLVRVTGSQGGTAASCTAKLSVDLILKGGLGTCTDPGGFAGYRS